ncbi:MAG: ATP-binding protein [Epulopiscium sp.]|nr:ATP-binding protein [Candidatus Epulonipiscium sp.]
MKIKLYEKTFSSQLDLVKPLLREIMNYLSRSFPSLSPEDFFDCKLIYNELLVNAVIHGNENDKNKHVSVVIEILNKDSFSSIITDEGNGVDYESLINEISSSDRLFLERGRGIQLVKSLTNELYYDSSRNQIYFLKRMNQIGYNTSCR